MTDYSEIMSRHPGSNDTQMRRAIAVEAARIMAEQGIEDFLLAKRKAADRYKVSDQSALPGNVEIEAALREHQRLFRTDLHEQGLHALRTTALRLMRLLREFNPRLVGSVLSGSATATTEINLHVFVDRAEQVSLRLDEHGINHRHAEKKFRYEPERQLSYPSFKFVAGNQAIEVVAFPIDGLRQAPCSAVDGKPMARAELAQLEQLLK